MMQTSVATFFRFAAEYDEILVDFLHAREGWTEGEVLERLRRRRTGPGDPTAEHVLGRLIELGFIEPAPDASARFELTRFMETVLRHLLREQRLNSAAVVQGYLNDLQQASDQLAEAIQRENRSLAIRVLDEIAAQLDRIRHDSRANRDAITTIAIGVRANVEHRTPRERFEMVNRLWEQYLIPLRDLLDVDQAMEPSLDRLVRLFADGRTAFQSDGSVLQEFVRAGARLVRLRRDTAEDLRECMRELEPLYHGLRRDTRIVQGASEALRFVRENGTKALDLAARFSLASFRREGNLGDRALGAYLHEIARYEPPKPVALAEGTAAIRAELIDKTTLERSLSAVSTIDDCLAWLINRFPNASPTEILRAYGVFLSGALGATEIADEGERGYPVGGVTLLACPMRMIRQ